MCLKGGGICLCILGHAVSELGHTVPEVGHGILELVTCKWTDSIGFELDQNKLAGNKEETVCTIECKSLYNWEKMKHLYLVIYN